jgi:hypothetical protein
MVLLAAIFVGCPKSLGVTSQPPVVTDQDQCVPACAKLKELHCADGEPIDMKKSCVIQAECGPGQTCSGGTCHASCEQFCRDTEDQGVWLDPICVSQITSCDQVDSCPTPQPKK